MTITTGDESTSLVISKSVEVLGDVVILDRALAF